MAENGDGSVANLDLEQILKTLASLPQNPATPLPSQQEPIINQPQPEPALYDPAHVSLSRGHEQPLDPRMSGRPALSHRQATPQHRTATPIIDPASITEWKHGLRCVSKIAAQNSNFAPSVQKLIKDQERNMKDWEAGRRRLIDDHAVKRESEKTHRAALSLPGIQIDSVPLRTPEQEQKELADYDRKVYRACCQMVEVQSAALKNLGVPFFGVRPELLLPDDAEAPQDEEDTVKKIRKKDVLELQRKMLNHLHELYGD